MARNVQLDSDHPTLGHTCFQQKTPERICSPFKDFLKTSMLYDLDRKLIFFDSAATAKF